MESSFLFHLCGISIGVNGRAWVFWMSFSVGGAFGASLLEGFCGFTVFLKTRKLKLEAASLFER